MTIEESIVQFKERLKQFDEKEIVRKYITYGECHVIDQEKYSSLKGNIADHFNLHPNEVLMVGSGKLGFSLSENKTKHKLRYRHFSDTSDIDIAIISTKLFDDLWEQLYKYIQEGGNWEKQRAFAEYHFQGWMRPDMLPITPRFEFTQKEWWDFFNNLTSSQKYGVYKIRAGLYRNWNFLESYQLRNVKECKIELKLRR